MTDQDTPVLLEVKNIKTYFELTEGTVRAVDDASFTLRQGETLGVVGESGCGKSVMARSILRIVPSPGKTVEGEIIYHQPQNGSIRPIKLTDLDPKGQEIRSIRGAEISMVFQEPMTSLSPVHTIGFQIMEAVLLHQDVNKDEAYQIALESLRLVGMPQAENVMRSYSYQVSGGMRQRAMIAMALSCRPQMLIADEPTTALDVTTQAQILKLMRQLQQELGMAIMFITHDLGVIAQMTENVIVMYLGRVVEAADVVSIFYEPRHPYTQALLKSIPLLGQKKTVGRLSAIHGNVPDPYNIPTGCPFHPRCSFNDRDRCIDEVPTLREIKPGQYASCHYAEQLDLQGIRAPRSAQTIQGES